MMFLGLRHTNSKKENRLLKANINYKARRGLDFGENYNGNVATFFSQI
jgi:hypothetical protein